MSAKTDPTWGKMSVLSGAINLALTFIGVNVLGLVGVALGTMISQLLTNNWYAVVKTLRIVQMRFSQYVWGSGVFWFATGVVLLAAMNGIRSLTLSPAASVLAGAGVTALICGGIIVLYLKRRPVISI
jgi:O-antigen/teichoic acid export membrane protein